MEQLGLKANLVTKDRRYSVNPVSESLIEFINVRFSLPLQGNVGEPGKPGLVETRYLVSTLHNAQSKFVF